MAVEDTEHGKGSGVNRLDAQVLLGGLVYLRDHGLVNRDSTMP